MRFSVPQFIDVEDKIFGPFTFKQFIYLVGGGGLGYLTYKVLPLLFAIPVITIIVGFAVALAFYKINNKPFIFTLEAYIKYLFQNKLYIWKYRKAHQEQEKEPKAKKEAGRDVPVLSESRLNDLSWSLDILDMNLHDQ